jgi:hypothetical protein
MPQDYVLWVQLVGSLAALAGLICALVASRLLRNHWFQTTDCGEWATVGLLILSFGVAGVAATLVWKAIGIAGFSFYLCLGVRRPKPEQPALPRS